MEVIRFESGECIYRPAGAHPFVDGLDGVAYVRQTPFTLSRALRSPSRAIVKNLCGRFKTFVDCYIPHRTVSLQNGSRFFGKHQTMHHLHGTVDLYRGAAYFKGCAGAKSVRELSKDLFLDSDKCEIHMGVFKVCLGRRLATTHGCYMEGAVSRRFRKLRVRRRLDENTQAVKLRIDCFDQGEFPHLSGQLVPTSVDASVTGSGVLLLRFSWSRCEWNEDTEASALRFCDWVAQELRECC